MAEHWLSIVEYARRYKVSDMTVRRRIKTGKLEAVLQDGKYYIPVAANGAAPAPAAPSPENSVMKSHPAAHKTYAQPTPMPHVEARQIRTHIPQPMPHQPAPVMTDEQDFAGDTVPGTLRRPLAAQDTSLVDTRALLAYCDATLRKLGEGERRTVEKFKAKLEALESALAGKDLEIKALKQQMEDLQLLVRILEKKKPA